MTRAVRREGEMDVNVRSEPAGEGQRQVQLADEMIFVLTSVEDFLGRLTLKGDQLCEAGMLLRSVEDLNRKMGIDPPEAEG